MPFARATERGAAIGHGTQVCEYIQMVGTDATKRAGSDIVICMVSSGRRASAAQRGDRAVGLGEPHSTDHARWYEIRFAASAQYHVLHFESPETLDGSFRLAPRDPR